MPGDDLLGDGARQGRPGGLAAPVSDTGRVTTGLNRITWAAALAAVFAAVGVSAFTLPYGPTRNLVDMIEENLVAERIAVETYRDLIRYFGDKDPTTRVVLERILAQEEEHANDMHDLLVSHEGRPMLNK